ncbi:MAG: hypothetical protein CSB47_01965 [Proteobacteria bacterium]|nr:MAG: hypothetical protein CSB47_01965 [Pseudomonadota bacterium]
MANQLQDLVNPKDKLMLLERMIDWDLLSADYQSKFGEGRAPSPRLLFGLLYLQAKEDIDCEELMRRWEKTPEWQHFCGETKLNDRFPLHPSQLSIWRREVGEKGCKLMRVALAKSLPELPVTH